MREQVAGGSDKEAAISIQGDIVKETAFPSLDLKGAEVPEALPRVVVLIPSYNEERSIAAVVEGIPRELPNIEDVRVLVVDDGSEDETAPVATRAGADMIVRHKTNLGLGQTFKDGLEASLRAGADIIVSLDADGQHNPGEIPILLEPIVRDEADIVIGYRQISRDSDMRWSRRWGNRFVSWLTRRLSGLDLHDTQSGFRALSREAAMRLTLNRGYTYTQEMVIQAAHKGLVVAEVPITHRKRVFGESKMVPSVWKYAAHSGAMILRSYRDHKPLMVFALAGTALFSVAVLLGLLVFFHFLNTGTIGPYFWVAVLAATLGVLGIQVIGLGLVADMLRSRREIEDEILLRLRRNEYERTRR